MYAKGVLFRDIIFVLRASSFVATELPVHGEESPESGYQFPSPQLAGLFFEIVARSEVCFLVVDNGLSDVTSKEVLPADGFLVLRCAKQRFVPLEPLGNARLTEPLNQTLRYERTNRLRCVASMIEVVQVDGEKTSLECETIWVWATKKMGVIFMNSAAVKAAVVFELIVTVYCVASR